MKKESVNKAFILLDKTLKDMVKISYTINDKKQHGFTYRTNHDPENLAYKKCEKNKLLWQTTEPDHNGYYTCFLFKTVNKYRNTSPEYRDVVLKNSELRKVLLKNNIAEVGITIENVLRNPTETCWGYSFGRYQYYIIKDGVTTFSEKRSVIRKIYNNKPITKEDILIRVGEYEGEKTLKIDNLTELHKGVFKCTINGENYLIGKEKTILKYGCQESKKPENREWIIEYLGGTNGIIDSYISGHKFDLESCFNYHWEDFANFMKLDLNEWQNNDKNRIQHSNYDADNKGNSLNGLMLYKWNK